MKRTVRLLSLLAAMLLLLAACSSAEETGDAATEAVAAPSSEAVSEPAVAEPSEPVATDGADTGTDTTASDQTILEIAQENPQLSQLVAALEAAGLTDALQQAGPLTVFAPNDEAFGKLNQSDLTALLADPTQLGDILQYHVVEGSFPSSDLTDGESLTTLQGSDLPVTIDGSTVMVGDATVVQADIQAGNGVIHVIDTVLQPPS